jgi:hypothetical protein
MFWSVNMMIITSGNVGWLVKEAFWDVERGVEEV